MKIEHTSALLLGFIIFTCGVSEAIECYQCQTLDDGPGCGDKDGFDTSMPYEDTLGGNYLAPKCDYCTKAKAVANDVEYVARSCLAVTTGTKLDKCVEWDYMGNKGEMCTCSEHLCNSSTWPKASVSILISTLVVTYAQR